MKVCTRARYGLRAMLDLALNAGNGPVRMVDVAERQEISRKYLDSIITTLKVGGLVRSVLGPGGGYTLAKPASEIKVYEIIHLLEGSLLLVDCIEDEELCRRADSCATRDLWLAVGQAVEDVLSGLTLQDLADRQRKKSKKKRSGTR